MTVTGLRCQGDMTHEQAERTCASQGKALCTHAQMESAFQCGYRTTVCGWTKSMVKNGGRLVERILSKELQICELEESDKNNQEERTFGAHCCDAIEETTAAVLSSRRFLRRRR